jgi:hypothetical protein
MRHLAQINIGRIRAPLDDPMMAGFVSRLDEINALAEATEGFVWRLKGDGNDATSIHAYDDPRTLMNMSVWESYEALHRYVYRSDHVELVRLRARWFEKMDGPYYALWWIPAGHIPSVAEGVARLEQLRTHGPSADVFWFVLPAPARGGGEVGV